MTRVGVQRQENKVKQAIRKKKEYEPISAKARIYRNLQYKGISVKLDMGNGDNFSVIFN